MERENDLGSLHTIANFAFSFANRVPVHRPSCLIGHVDILVANRRTETLRCRLRFLQID